MGTQKVKIYEEPKEKEEKKPAITETQKLKKEISVSPTLKKPSVPSVVTKVRGKNYQEAKNLVDPNKFYDLDEALDLVKKTSFCKFDASLEIHAKLKSKKGEKKEFHQKIGKILTETKKLKNELQKIIESLRSKHPEKITICSTMGPGIKIQA